jgi:ribosomal protein S18 acetylase RimI-like enzyme
MPEPTIRLIQKDDIETFVDLGLNGLLEFCNNDSLKQSTLCYHDQHKNKTIKFLTNIIDTDFNQFNKRAWVAIDGDNIVGTILLQPRPRKPINDKDGASITNVYVAPQFRGAGIAQRLLETVETHCIKHNIKNVHLITQNNLTRAIRFYEKEGYVTTSQKNGNHIF